MNEIWNSRYSVSEFVYGFEPNEFLKNELVKNAPGKILLPADGEGRNSVYSASIGYEVDAFDFSSAAREKALKLAENRHVRIHYQIADIDNIDAFYFDNYFDYIALIYAHFPSNKRSIFHRKILEKLKPGGKLILEAFSKEQLPRTSGGPKNEDLLYNIEDLNVDFNFLSKANICKTEIILNEGSLHQGLASVIRVLGVK